MRVIRKCGWRRGAGLAALTVLTACAGQPVRLGTGTTSVAADEALVMPPVGQFAISGITQKRFNNALQQEIFLTTNSAVPGQNVVQVRFFGTARAMNYGGGHLAFAPITEARVDSEMRGTLPGVPMARASYLVQNDFGPFGYAFGQPSPGELCMYGWQQLRAAEGERPPFANGGAIQIRVRLCDAGATEKQLLAFMYGFTINGSVDNPNWNPYGSPPPLRDRLGQSGAPVWPGAEPVMPDAVTMPALKTGSIPQAAPAPRRRAAPAPVSEPAMAPTRPALPQGMEQVVVPSPVRAAPAPAVALPAGRAPAAVAVPTPAASGTIVPSPCADADLCR